ncbi:MAG TPA: sigma 54-interacting transcriptional regulator, partial [Pyrinomonadaceae bacterium]|nr:sigma 54-interacting transcriptional regulator [Pyrinomonadaceae bacterium]
RALQEGEIRRVGSNNTISVDVRVIAASNRDVDQELREGHFRQDLFYRLNAVTLHLPPLRERAEDILPLARFFAARTVPAGAPPVSFSREAIELLKNYDYPGNIRELENAIVRAAALCDQVIRPEDLPERVRELSKPAVEETTTTTAQPVEPTEAKREEEGEELLSLAEVEGRHIFRVLAHTGGNKQAAARVLGIDRTTLQRKLERYNLERNGADAGAAKESKN